MGSQLVSLCFVAMNLGEEQGGSLFGRDYPRLAARRGSAGSRAPCGVVWPPSDPRIAARV